MSRYAVKLGELHLVSDRPIGVADRSRILLALANRRVPGIRTDYKNGQLTLYVSLDDFKETR